MARGAGTTPALNLSGEALWNFLLGVRQRLSEDITEFYYPSLAFGFVLPRDDEELEFLPSLLNDAQDAGFSEGEVSALRLYLPILFGGYFARRRGTVHTVAHLAQTLDGRIATRTGRSRWISNEADLVHVHRMRGLMDGVLVGRATAENDRPRLNVRHVDGPDPVRIVLGGVCRPADRVLTGEGRSLCVHGETALCKDPSHLKLPAGELGMEPRDVLKALAARGVHSLLVEGGGETVSRFLSAGCCDVLQLHLSPVILGSGVPAIHLPAVDTMEEALRMRMTSFNLDGEILVECRKDRPWTQG